ncbi:MAG: hypothetical protein ACYC35_17420 [Pirellulales bacterium]
MTPDLTDQQRQALHEANDAGPVIVIDPTTHTRYVLVREDVLCELQEWARDLQSEEVSPMVDRVMANDDAHDPLLASYQDEALL